MEPPWKRAKTTKETRESVVFLTCAVQGQDFTSNLNLGCFLKAVRNTLGAGAKIVNIVFTKVIGNLVNIRVILPELKSVFEAAWGLGSVEQLAYSVRRVGSMMSFFSPHVVLSSL